MSETEQLVAIPFTPRPRLFLVLSILFALWIGAMLWMYFATVYPHRNLTPPATKELSVDR